MGKEQRDSLIVHDDEGRETLNPEDLRQRDSDDDDFDQERASLLGGERPTKAPLTPTEELPLTNEYDIKIDKLNKSGLKWLNRARGARYYLDTARAIQTGLSDKPPILDVDVKTTPLLDNPPKLENLLDKPLDLTTTFSFKAAFLNTINAFDKSKHHQVVLPGGIPFLTPLNNIRKVMLGNNEFTNKPVFSEGFKPLNAFRNIGSYINNTVPARLVKNTGKRLYAYTAGNGSLKEHPIVRAGTNMLNFTGALIKGKPIEDWNDNDAWKKKPALEKIGAIAKSRPMYRFLEFRGRQVAGAVLTMGVHAANTVIKPFALKYHNDKVATIEASMKDKKDHPEKYNGENSKSRLCNQASLDHAKEERIDTAKNFALAAVLTGVMIGGNLLAAGVGSVVAAEHVVAAHSAGLVTTNNIEIVAAMKKTALVMKEESEHLLDLERIKNPTQEQQQEINKSQEKLKEQRALIALYDHNTPEHLDSLSHESKAVAHLSGLQTVINSKDAPNASREERIAASEARKMASAQQKRILHLHSQLDPTFMSHDAKLKTGLTTEKENEMRERVGKEMDKEILHYHKMKEVLQEHAGVTTPTQIDAMSQFFSAIVSSTHLGS